MKHENENAANLHTGLKRREFMAMLAGCTASLMVPSLTHGEEKIATTTASRSDRLGKLLPQRKLGTSGPAVTNLGVGGDHVGSASEKDAQAIIEKALEEGVRFFDNAPFYSGGKAEERYGKFLTPKYRDVSFIMTKTLARNRKSALKDLDNSLSRMKTDYVDLWQMHALGSPRDVEERVQNGVLDAFLEAQKKGKVRHIGFTGHSSYKAHLKMLEELKKRGVKMVSSQMPVNPADPHYESFVTHVVPKCMKAGIGVLDMKTAAGPAEPGSIHHQAALAGVTISAGRTTESMSSNILMPPSFWAIPEIKSVSRVVPNSGVSSISSSLMFLRSFSIDIICSR